MIRYIGDTHGKWSAYKKILKESPYPTIQVGDLGIGFYNRFGEPSANAPYDLMMSGGHRAIRGNHDNPSVFARMDYAIADGHYENETMFIGGAASIDKEYRIEGISWWKDEELSMDRLQDMIDIYIDKKPKIMITHTAPLWIPKQMGIRLFENASLDTEKAFAHMFEIHRPEIWIYGHWHQSFDKEILGTRFICLNELETKDI